MSGKFVDIQGIDRTHKMLTVVTPREADELARSATQAVAQIVRRAMKRKVKLVAYDTGTLHDAIQAKRRRGKKGKRYSDIYVTHGTEAKHDAWYWHLIEFEYGGVKRTATPFIWPTIREFEPHMPSLYREELGKKIEKKLAKKAKTQGVGK